MKVDENKKVTLYCSLQWLNVFIGFLQADIETAQSTVKLKTQGFEGIEEETKEPLAE